VEPDPSIETVAAGMGVCFHEKPDVLIALGGGSAIDATKALLYFCLKYKSGLMDEKYVHKPHFIAIPTTSGTGSEVTGYSVITDRRANVKIPLTDRCMIPDVAILCPAYTESLPKHMVAFTGMDVLTHALEAYVCKTASAFTDMHATEAARKTLKYLPAAWSAEAGKENPAVEQMMVASTMAGLAFSNSGLGVCHGLAHSVGALFHIPHGKANSIILPYAIAFTAGLWGYDPQPATLARYALLCRRMGHAFGLAEDDDAEAAARLLETVRGLNRTFGIPETLKEAGVPRADYYEHLDRTADQVLQDITTGANPVPVRRGDARRLLTDIYEGRGGSGTEK
jgi:alcohol dehydrogenase class IV